MDDETEDIVLGDDEDEDVHGSPKSVAWKYAWSMNSSAAGSAAASGAGNAASERLYRGARSMRQTRENMQRQEQQREEQTVGKQSHINKKSAQIAENRFDDVMNRTAIGRYRKEVKALAAVRGGAQQGQRVQKVFNYGDMLFQEGKLTAARKERVRHDELRRREEHDPECTFRPKVSGFAKQFGHSEHMSERTENLLVEHQEKMQALATQIRSEADRELTFKPAIVNKKTIKLAGERDKDFVVEMEKRTLDHESKMQALRSQYEEQDRSCFTYKPEIGRPPASMKPARGEAGAPVYERLHGAHTAAYASSLSAPATSDPECTFHPNVGEADKPEGASSAAAGGGVKALPRAQLEEVGDALYKDAHNRRLRRQMLEEQLNAELEEVRSSAKLSSKSNQLAFHKLQRDVADIFARLEAEERGISYGELAAAMVELGLFKTSTPAAPASAEAKAEVLLLQRVWRHLVPSAEPSATLAAPPLLKFLRCSLLPPDDGRAERAAAPAPAADPTLFADFAQLWRNTLSYKSIRNVRGETEAALQVEAAACTFNPQIDKKSRQLDQLPSGPKRAHQLYEHARALENKQERARIATAEEQMKACSFKPEINRPKGSVVDNGFEAGARLYAHAQYKMGAEAEAAKLSTTELELAQECTFRPQLTAYSPRKGDVKPHGFSQAVGRMRRAQEEREVREAEEASVASARAAPTSSATGKTEPKPFSFQTDRRQERKQPLLYMDVNLGPGRTGRIGLHQGDDAAQLAANFARAYQLDGSMRARLQQLIEKYMAEVLPGLASQAGSPVRGTRTPATAQHPDDD